MHYDSNLDRLTVVDLRALAGERKIAGRSKMKRDELVAAITEAEAANEAAKATEAVREDAEQLTGEVTILKYHGHGAVATAAFGTELLDGRATRDCGRWVLRQGDHTIRAKTLGKVGKLWAKRLGFYATVVDVKAINW